MSNKVTIQNIADALGLSRNTVSKAINNTGVLADDTREKIIKKAIEMGYKQFAYISSDSVFPSREVIKKESDLLEGDIAIITGVALGTSHFSYHMLDVFQREIASTGLHTTMHRITDEEFESLSLPASLKLSTTKAIMCFEVFDYEYSKMLCSLGIAVLFVDTPVLFGQKLNADRLYMNNTDEILNFISIMKRKGKTRFGFIGEYLHCQSFFERYKAFKDGLFLHDLDFNPQYCISNNAQIRKHPENTDYQEYLYHELSKLKKKNSLPEVFICANDFVAIDALQVFRKLNISIPDDIFLLGFDDSPESKIVTPPLSTIHIHGDILGFSAMQLLLSRIQNPELKYRTLYTETNLVLR